MISFIQFFLEAADAEILRQLLPSSLGLKSKMAYLPDSPPYGFWMDKHGNYIVVLGRIGHEMVAKEILIRANDQLSKREQLPLVDLYDTLLRAGWARIVIAPAAGSLYGETIPGGLPTISQKRNMEFIKDFYDLKRVEMG
jgi:hypothetical protein